MLVHYYGLPMIISNAICSLRFGSILHYARLPSQKQNLITVYNLEKRCAYTSKLHTKNMQKSTLVPSCDDIIEKPPCVIVIWFQQQGFLEF